MSATDVRATDVLGGVGREVGLPGRRLVDRWRAAGAIDAATMPAPIAVRAVAAALALGVVSDLLLRAAPPAVNVPICTAFGLAVLAWLAHGLGRPLTVGAVAVGALALAFAGAMAWRDSTVLLLFNGAALASTACALVAMVRHGPALPLDSAGPGAYVRGAVDTAFDLAAGAPSVGRPAFAAVSGRARRVSTAIGIGLRGTAMALPALAVFGSLLVAADGAFARLATTLVDWNAATVVVHALWIGGGAWVAAGYLAAALRPAADAMPADAMLAGAMPVPPLTGDDAWAVGRVAARGPRIGGAAEWCVALALVDVLFIVFGVVQLGWLFGGRALVASTSVTYAEYARRGFFELVTVAALALPVALGAYTAGVRRLDAAAAYAPRVRRALRVAAGTLLACVGIVLVSAADRMRLYQDAYGLTELRFYAAAFMGWIAVMAACATATVLRDRPAPFALGALTSTWLWVLALDAADPDARIVGANVERARAGRPFDAAYVAALSADAVPGLLAFLVTAPGTAAVRGGDPCTVVHALDNTRRAGDAADWRGWHVARARATRLLDRAERDGRIAPWRAACAATTVDATGANTPGA